jgi:hypothetical protein
MSQENVEIVRRGFTVAMEEDWQTALDTVTPRQRFTTLTFQTPGHTGATTAFWCGLRTGARAGSPGGYFNDEGKALHAVGLST